MLTSQRLIISFFFLLFISPFSTFAMEFAWSPDLGTPKGSEGKPEYQAIHMDGVVKAGDYARFQGFLSSHFDAYLRSGKTIYLSSNGGDIAETLNIAQLVKAIYAEVLIPDESVCASSCFLIYVSAVQRARTATSKLGIPRAYFEPQYFAGLGAAEAERRQIALTAVLRKFLESAGVPR